MGSIKMANLDSWQEICRIQQLSRDPHTLACFFLGIILCKTPLI